VIHESPSPRRQRRRERQVEAILSAAMDLLLAHGFDDLTMVGLAEKLDLTPGALYRYFESKDALVVALQARALETLRDRYLAERAALAARLPSAPKTAALCEILVVARFYLSLPQREPRVFRLVSLNLAAGRNFVDDEQVKPLAPPIQALFLDFAQALARAAEVGALAPGDPLERALSLWSALHGAALVDKLDRLMPRERRADVRGSRVGLITAEALLRGFGAPAPSLAAALAWLKEQT
jgi:AcrR family transcriptional regulator